LRKIYDAKSTDYKQDFNYYFFFCKKPNCSSGALLKLELYGGNETASVCRSVSKFQDNVRCPQN